ncbi:hypothetical protein AYO46_00525 [Betaproteobacteria bacterium SCGC AG-212-J23]|nr:hypothetical protein AYO46_00525 [Betaproteobacteria bacterium SCGC AG-212-J23]
MNRAEQSLAQRRRELVERSASQRASLVTNAEPLLHKAEALDRLVTRVRRYPMATAAVAAAVVFLGSRRIFDLATRALTIYALFKR